MRKQNTDLVMKGVLIIATAISDVENVATHVYEGAEPGEAYAICAYCVNTNVVMFVLR
jgi:hypothetical protein